MSTTKRGKAQTARNRREEGGREGELGVVRVKKHSGKSRTQVLSPRKNEMIRRNS